MSDEKQRVGRRRDSRVDHAIVAATRELLAEAGYANLTVDAVAARAGIGKAAIYRRYATKQEMVFAAAVHDLDLQPPADTGSLRGDLGALVDDILASLTGPAAFGAIPGLLADITSDETMSDRFHRTFVAHERACIAELLDRAVRRGELAERPDTSLVHALLLGPIFTWLFLWRYDGARDFAARLADLAAAALTATALTPAAPTATASTAPAGRPSRATRTRR